MKKYIIAISACIVLNAASPAIVGAEHDSDAPLYIKRVELCTEKPKGLGRFSVREGNEYESGEPVFIYVEVGNCKAQKEVQYYYIRLTMGIDIFYNDGMRIYSEEEASVINRPLARKKTESYLQAKIETLRLKEGEYKAEMSIRDENSGKEAFALARFKVRSGN